MEYGWLILIAILAIAYYAWTTCKLNSYLPSSMQNSSSKCAMNIGSGST